MKFAAAYWVPSAEAEATGGILFSAEGISVLRVNNHPSNGVISVLSVNYHPSDGVISVLSIDYYPSGRVISIKSQFCIPSAENNFPPVASALAEGTQYAAVNFNLSSVVLVILLKPSKDDLNPDCQFFFSFLVSSLSAEVSSEAGLDGSEDSEEELISDNSKLIGSFL